MSVINDSLKRESWLSLGRFRIPNRTHLILLAIQRRFCHSTLRDSAIFLMNEGAAAVSAKEYAEGNVQIVTNRDEQGLSSECNEQLGGEQSKRSRFLLLPSSGVEVDSER